MLRVDTNVLATHCSHNPGFSGLSLLNLHLKPYVYNRTVTKIIEKRCLGENVNIYYSIKFHEKRRSRYSNRVAIHLRITVDFLWFFISQRESIVIEEKSNFWIGPSDFHFRNVWIDTLFNPTIVLRTWCYLWHAITAEGMVRSNWNLAYKSVFGF